jgi:hypothetical protein
MLTQVLLTVVTSAGSSALGWFLCRQYMVLEMRKSEDRSRQRQQTAERKIATLKTKLEIQVLQARLDESRRLMMLLSGQLPEMPVTPQPALGEAKLNLAWNRLTGVSQIAGGRSNG